VQTKFTPDQLRQPDIARADSILRKCVHCGFCIATCPTYVVTGDERDSPRGRIWLIRDLLENDNNDGMAAGHHLDRCLTCLSCTSTCPSGVDYMHLLDIGRHHVDQRRKRKIFDHLRRKMLTALLPHAGRAYITLMLGWLVRPLRIVLPKFLSELLTAIPSSMPKFDFIGSRDKVFYAENHHPRARVALLTGCTQRAINPDINAATVRLLNRIGVEVVVRKSAFCCGAMAHHTGDETAAQNAMLSTINAWMSEQRRRRLDAIIINTSGCGTMVKDYADRFANDPIMAAKAAEISAMTMDITEFLDHLGFGLSDNNTEFHGSNGISVAYHAACSLQHGQKIKTIPKDLLRRVGFEVQDIADGHLCCGSAGAYNVLEPDIANALKTRKLKALDAVKADVVATGNLGCMNQLKESLAPVVHTVQLLDWATGGVKPPNIKSDIAVGIAKKT
jgi:glycolate oxidase iron-sulfur subunit